MSRYADAFREGYAIGKRRKQRRNSVFQRRPVHWSADDCWRVLLGWRELRRHLSCDRSSI